MAKKLTFLGVALVLTGTLLIVYASSQGEEAKGLATAGYVSFALGAVTYFLNRLKTS